jgi:hypothetical protein
LRQHSKTTNKGVTGCLALIVDEAEMSRVAKNNTLNYNRVTMPAMLILKITDKTSNVGKKNLAMEHKQTWYKYYLN